MTRTPAGRIVWGAALLLGGIIEAWGVAHPRHNETLSEFTRWSFRVDDERGKYAFLVVWGTFAAWFAQHIIGGASRHSTISKAS